MRVDNGTVNFAVYENSVEYLGMAEATLPKLSAMSEEVKGAGISGALNGAFLGHFEAMSLTLNFRNITSDVIRLFEPYEHQIDLRVAQQAWDAKRGAYKVTKLKHLFLITPKEFDTGKVAPASPADASGEFPCSYMATFIDGKKVLEIDILNFIFEVNGTNYLAEVKEALAK